MRIGIDTGGTFTDFVVLRDDGSIESFKLRSNPRSPALVILDGLRRIAAPVRTEVVHGSTVATNALLERKGARTALVTTEGFADLVRIGRQNRAQLYNLTPPLKRYLVPASLCFGVCERTYFDGCIGKRPGREELARLKVRLKRAGVESVAICFLHSYENDENEQVAARVLSGSHYLCCSHEVSPEFREYERASTTLINAYVGPLMDAYLSELDRSSRHPVSILQSNGGYITAAEARRHAVRTILSGPAGGVVGAGAAARWSGFERALTFDMGGTSTDVSLWEGRLRLALDASVDGMPVRVPMLDIHTVGAGGGSIARVDEGGLLRVGPESAGADPGPACYGVGERATVTDAHVVLGRIAPDQFLGGEMKIDAARAAAAVDQIARRLRRDRVIVAQGIVRVANANMERAVRVVSVERGRDPRDFPMLAFGGCGGLHACEMAEELGIRTVIVPRWAGALSALGMLLADRVRDYSAGVLDPSQIEKRFAQLERAARHDMRGAELERMADIRYVGQSYELTIPWGGSFHDEHQRIYGYCDPARPTEIVTIRVRAKIAVEKPKPPRQRKAGLGSKPESRPVFAGSKFRMLPVFAREQVRERGEKGPALVVDYGATTLIPPGWNFAVDRVGNLVARR
ncbi:MAG TPA: hydantoinase/oxoprolinase family protein [Bryobacteraceae bacterium]|nr:hydantoinase/oxoprolinase family protein [Bryobacteraceae bacterium]